MSGNYLGASTRSTRERLNFLEDAVNGARLNKSVGSLSSRGSGGSSMFTPKARIISVPADFTIYDASSGSQPAIGVTPGTITDTTNGGSTTPYIWIPTINDPVYGPTQIDTQVGSPLRFPRLNVSPTSASWLYFNSAIDSANGYITAMEIDPATSVPSSTSSIWYLPLGQFSAVVTSGVASVHVISNSRGSKVYKFCNPLPAIDGSSYVSGLVGS